MKKYSFLMLLLITVVLQVKATDWFPIGAKWTWDYKTCCQGQPTTSKWEITKDTIIGADTIKIMDTYEHQYQTRERILVFEKNKIAYQWYNNQFLPICDFNKNENDTMIFVDAGFSTMDTIKYVIDSIKPLPDNNMLRIQYIRPIYASGQFSMHLHNLPKIIIERALFINYNSIANFFVTDGNYEIDLRCYQDEQYEFGSHNYNCDTLLSSVRQRLNTNLPITIFPNPTADKLQMEYKSSKIYKSASIIISDIQGKTLYSNEMKNIATLPTIDVSAFSNGMYFIKMVIDDEFVTKPVIIQH